MKILVWILGLLVFIDSGFLYVAPKKVLCRVSAESSVLCDRFAMKMVPLSAWNNPEKVEFKLINSDNLSEFVQKLLPHIIIILNSSARAQLKELLIIYDTLGLCLSDKHWLEKCVPCRDHWEACRQAFKALKDLFARLRFTKKLSEGEFFIQCREYLQLLQEVQAALEPLKCLPLLETVSIDHYLRTIVVKKPCVCARTADCFIKCSRLVIPCTVRGLAPHGSLSLLIEMLSMDACEPDSWILKMIDQVGGDGFAINLSPGLLNAVNASKYGFCRMVNNKLCAEFDCCNVAPRVKCSLVEMELDGILGTDLTFEQREVILSIFQQTHLGNLLPQLEETCSILLCNKASFDDLIRFSRGHCGSWVKQDLAALIDAMELWPKEKVKFCGLNTLLEWVMPYAEVLIKAYINIWQDLPEEGEFSGIKPILWGFIKSYFNLCKDIKDLEFLFLTSRCIEIRRSFHPELIINNANWYALETVNAYKRLIIAKREAAFIELDRDEVAMRVEIQKTQATGWQRILMDAETEDKYLFMNRPETLALLVKERCGRQVLSAQEESLSKPFLAQLGLQVLEMRARCALRHSQDLEAGELLRFVHQCYTPRLNVLPADAVRQPVPTNNLDLLANDGRDEPIGDKPMYDVCCHKSILDEYLQAATEKISQMKIGAFGDIKFLKGSLSRYRRVCFFSPDGPEMRIVYNIVPPVEHGGLPIINILHIGLRNDAKVYDQVERLLNA